MHTKFNEQVPLPILRHTLWVMGLCFLANVTVAPWWIIMLAITAISYRLLTGYFSYPLLPQWALALLVLIFLAVLRIYYQSFLSADFFIGALLTFFWLKIVELHRIRDVRILILCSFYVILVALILHQTLWILLYLLAAMLANLSLLLRLYLPQLTLKALFIRSTKLLLIAIPISVLLFFLFPRTSSPLWRVNLPAQGKVAFRESISPGALSSLFPDDSTVMRITFKRVQSIKDFYWHGLILNHFDGVNWTSKPQPYNYLSPLTLLPTKQDADYEVLLEAHNKNWLFYLNRPKAGWPNLQFSEAVGLMRLDHSKITQRFAYALTTQKPAYKPLSSGEIRQNLQYPSHVNPKLKTWALQLKHQVHGHTKAMVDQILLHIHQQPFWYTLHPKPIGDSAQQLDYFWFSTREGYCEHYASAVAFILRAAGIPARIVVGYYGGEWNPYGHYLNVRQKDAHAWLEYWLEGEGWKRVDPSAFIAKQRIETDLLGQNSQELGFYIQNKQYSLNLAHWQQLRLTLESMRFFWERWLIFYNQDRQQSLLQLLGLGAWDFEKLLQLWLLGFLFFLAGSWCCYIWWHPKDPMLREYHRLQREFKRLKIPVTPYQSLTKQWNELGKKFPELTSLLQDYLARYEALRLRHANSDDPKNRKAVRLLLRALRKQVQKL
ncbi:DUF3488 and transglutaminase-like domain-containing protein [Legionella sp. 27cVA30]|uniref:DUF3488 domain-containing protein n=1 Tax=Legionella septentrionalis TaxID=2498109 RepID=A0A3S0VBA8_9GAMM|nr:MULTISPECIES: DUF3488 and transglutaminase-like domain-containing protein [Legionella]MCP0914461.1 DUF3488 and transglutaminase-like domain-containing protein [Legionella sp. 27cVA30]RUQ89475.1 DUF3488 domain-containing protein [Legionella septentrionalis]